MLFHADADRVRFLENHLPEEVRQSDLVFIQLGQQSNADKIALLYRGLHYAEGRRPVIITARSPLRDIIGDPALEPGITKLIAWPNVCILAGERNISFRHINETARELLGLTA